MTSLGPVVARRLLLQGLLARPAAAAAATRRWLASGPKEGEAAAATAAAATATAAVRTEAPAAEAASRGSYYTNRPLTVADVLRVKGEKYFSTRSDVLVYDAVHQMVRLNIGSLVVVDHGDTAAGIVTERDYLEKIIVLGRSSRTTRVREIMSEKELVAVSPSTTLTECMNLMAENRVRHIPVIVDGKVKGLVSIGDVVKELVEMHKRNADHMSSFISGGY